MKNSLVLLAALALGGTLGGCSPRMGAALSAEEMSAPLPAGTPYALLHFYRPGKFVGFLVCYDVHLNDSVVYRARNGSRQDVPYRRRGPVTAWAKTEVREELLLNPEPGREYFISCGLGVGAFVGRPKLTLVAPDRGRKDVGAIGN